MRKALFFILLMIVFVSAIIIDRNVRQESKTALEVTIGHPEGLPPEEAGRGAPVVPPPGNPPPESRPERSEPTQRTQPTQSTETPPPRDTRGERHVYVVQEGDTLSGIAKKLLGYETKVNLLIEWNALRNPDQIFPGDRLRYYN